MKYMNPIKHTVLLLSLCVKSLIYNQIAMKITIMHFGIEWHLPILCNTFCHFY